MEKAREAKERWGVRKEYSRSMKDVGQEIINTSRQKEEIKRGGKTASSYM